MAVTVGAALRPGPVELAPRERQVLALLGAGRAYGAIAKELGIAARTARSHGESARRKLRVRCSAGAVGAAIRDGHLPVQADPNPPMVDAWERYVIALLAAGWTEELIARFIGRSRGRVHEALEDLRRRLGAINHAHLVMRAAQAGAYPDPVLSRGKQ